jgi:hypothetical protein
MTDRPTTVAMILPRVTAASLRSKAIALSLLVFACIASREAGAQEQTVVSGPPLAPFAAMRVAIFPLQLWRADSSAWSKVADWAALRLEVDSAIAAELQARGLGKKWAYASDIARSAKRNPTYATDPYAIGVGRWRSMAPKAGDQVPTVVADNMRPLTALGDTRYALIPVELRSEGEHAVLRLVLADTRGRTVIWTVDVIALSGAALLDGLSKGVADLVIEP